jgi:hypothetical protein
MTSHADYDRHGTFSRHPEIRFYRQPGGCVEINQLDPVSGDQDVVHICDEPEALVEEFRAFIARTAPPTAREGSDHDRH